MPYRILAKNTRTGQTVTRMDLDYRNKPITDKILAQELADSFASTRGHGGPWQGVIKEYTASIANPNWDRVNGGKLR